MHQLQVSEEMRSQKADRYEGGVSRKKKARRGWELGLGQGLGRWPACRTGSGHRGVESGDREGSVSWEGP